MRVPAYVLALLLLAAPIRAADEPKRSSVPDAASVAEAEKTVKEVLKADLAKQKTLAARHALVLKLVRQAFDTADDQAARYVLFRESLDLAAQLGDAAVAFQIVDEMARDFDVNAIELKAAALEFVTKQPLGVAPANAAAQLALQLVDAAVIADVYDLAAQTAKFAEQFATKGRDPALARYAKVRAGEVTQIKAEQAKLKPVFDKLKVTPDDAESNLAAGKFKCFFKNDWEHGLPMLQKGNDETLAALADLDATGAVKPPQMIQAGDGWLKAAEAEHEPAKAHLTARAAQWLAKAEAQLTGVTKTKVSQRIAKLGGRPPVYDTTYITFAACRQISDVGDCADQNRWELKNGSLTISPDGGSNFWFKRRFDGPLWIRLSCETETDFGYTFASGNTDARGEFWQLEHVGREFKISLAHVRQVGPSVGPLPPGKHAIDVKVSRDEVQASLDGREVLRRALPSDFPKAHKVGFVPKGLFKIDSISLGSLLPTK